MTGSTAWQAADAGQLTTGATLRQAAPATKPQWSKRKTLVVIIGVSGGFWAAVGAAAVLLLG